MNHILNFPFSCLHIFHSILRLSRLVFSCPFLNVLLVSLVKFSIKLVHPTLEKWVLSRIPASTSFYTQLIKFIWSLRISNNFHWASHNFSSFSLSKNANNNINTSKFMFLPRVNSSTSRELCGKCFAAAS